MRYCEINKCRRPFESLVAKSGCKSIKWNKEITKINKIKIELGKSFLLCLRAYLTSKANYYHEQPFHCE